MPSLFSEYWHAARRLSRSPGFTAIALVTLAIGIGANTALFSVVRGVLLKPLPYPNSGRLIAVWHQAPGINMPNVTSSPSTYFTYREESRTMEEIGLWRVETVAVTGLAEPENALAIIVTDGTLPVLGVQPYRGRLFTRQDDSPAGPDTALLGYGYWQRKFGSDESVIGKRIVADGRAREIIGILPRDFRFMNMNPAMVLPFRFNRGEVFIGNFSYRAVARLKPGVSLAQANADVARMLPIMTQKFRPVAGLSLKMMEEARFGPNLRFLKDDVVGDAGKTLWVLMATVGIVLLVACANVANLLLVRAEGRQQELAIRAALGAGRLRIAGELLVESVALGALGGALGVGFAWAALRALVALAPARLPRIDEVSIDLPVLLFTLALSLAAGVLFGLIPVYKYAGLRPGIALREGGRTSSGGRERHRARGALVIAQVAMALVLLVSSGLMIRTLQALRHVQPGFTAPDDILTVRIAVPNAQVPDPERAVRMYHDILEKIRAIPSVTEAGATNSITMDGMDNNDPIYAEDRVYSENSLPPLRRYKYVSPGFFRTMGNPLLAGRDLTWEDVYQKRPVVLVSENLAREFWNDPAAAIGKRVRERPKGTWREIVGVVGDERDDGVDKKAPAVVYWPVLLKDMWQFGVRAQRNVAIAVRSGRARSEALVSEVRRAVWSVNPDLPLADIRTVREIYDRSLARTSFTFAMLSIAAGMALVLGTVGIYGVISYSVSQRTREIGIRIALGAQRPAVRRMFVRHGLMLTGIGVACGLAASVAVTRLMASLLFGVSPVDPATYLAVSAVLVAAALLAAYVPARKATAIEPVEALRAE
jgi:putative ABC transport system permease protein